MDIDKHKRTLGTLHIIYGVLVGLVFLFIGTIVTMFTPFIQDAIETEAAMNGVLFFETVTDIITLVFAFIFLFSALPSILGGIAMVTQKEWGLPWCLVGGCIALFSFPFGTALGVYTIYVHVQDKRNDEAESA